MIVRLISSKFFCHHICSLAVIRLSAGRKNTRFCFCFFVCFVCLFVFFFFFGGGRGKTKTKNRKKSGFRPRQMFWYFYSRNIFILFKCENEGTMLRLELYVCLSKTMHLYGSPYSVSIFKRAISLEIWDSHQKNWPFCSWKLLMCQKTAYCYREKMLEGVNRSECTKQVRVHAKGIHLKIEKKCCLYLYIFSCVKINVFRPFFAFRLKMHVRCNNQ